MSQFHFKPDEYLDLMHSEVPAFDELQERVSEAAAGLSPARILELGTGTGETSRRVLRAYPRARLTGIDVSEEMLAVARATLPPEQIDELVVSRIQEPLPEGPFDLTISALAVHHLDAAGKADLFHRLARVMPPGGRFVLGDVVIPEAPEDAVTPLSPGYDLPSLTDDLLRWLSQATFVPQVVWRFKDLAVISAGRP